MFQTDYTYTGSLIYPSQYVLPLSIAVSKAADPVERNVFLNYTASLLEHLFWVQAAGVTIGVPEEQLMVHDLSKMSEEEFAPYAHWFYGSKDRPRFEIAWLHHIHRNQHHPSHWALTPDYAAFMPDNFALEMIADWLGASKAYTGSWDISPWIEKTKGKILLHPDTARFVVDTLDTLGIVPPAVSQILVNSNPYSADGGD